MMMLVVMVVVRVVVLRQCSIGVVKAKEWLVVMDIVIGRPQVRLAFARVLVVVLALAAW